MPPPHFLAISCGARHLCSAHLKMNPSGRCELLDYKIDVVDFSSSEPLLWLKAVSSHLDEVALRFSGELPAGFAIPGHVALTKYLKIQQVSRGKRAKMVAFEAKQNIPYDISEVTWGHAVVEEDALDFDVLIGATRTEVVETISRYCKDSEIDLQTIQPSATALVNGFRYNYADRSGCSLIVSIGAKSTDLVFVEQTRYHSRNIPFGGQSISVEMAESLGVSVTEAESLKISASCGEPISSEAYSAFETALRGFVSRLTTEIARTRAVFERQGFKFDPQSFFLAGGSGQLNTLAERLAEKLGKPVELFDPLRNINVSKDEIRERLEHDRCFLADAIGLGVGRYLPDGVSIDLTPRSLVWQRKFRRQQPFYLLAGLVACGAVALPILNTLLELRTYRQENQNLDIQIRPLSQLNQSIFERTEQIKRIKDVIEKSASVADLRGSWVGMLNDLQRRLLEVEDVWLDKLRLERPEPSAPSGRGVPRVKKTDTRTKIVLEGRLIDVYNPVSSVSPDSYERVKELLENFRNSEYVEALEDERFDYSVPGILGFDFTLVLKPEVKL